MDTYYKVYVIPDKKTSGEAIHNSEADKVQLALNPTTKENLSLDCDESKASSSGLNVSDCSNIINLSSGSFHVTENILQVTKTTALEETILGTVISAGTELKEQAENNAVKQESQTKNSIFCTDKSKVRLKYN